MKTLNYTQRFSKYKNRETISAVRRCVLIMLSVHSAFLNVRSCVILLFYHRQVAHLQLFSSRTQGAVVLVSGTLSLYRDGYDCIDS